MLRGNAGRAFFDEAEVSLRFGCAERVLRVGVEECASATSGVEKQQLGGQCVGGDVGEAELRDAEFEGGAYVHVCQRRNEIPTKTAGFRNSASTALRFVRNDNLPELAALIQETTSLRP